MNQADHEPCYNTRVPSLLYETAAFPSGVKEATTVFDRYDQAKERPNGNALRVFVSLLLELHDPRGRGPRSAAEGRRADRKIYQLRIPSRANILRSLHFWLAHPIQPSGCSEPCQSRKCIHGSTCLPWEFYITVVYLRMVMHG